MATTSNPIIDKSQSLAHWMAKKISYHFDKQAQRSWKVKRGEVYFVDLGDNIGSEENKLRPMVILSSNSYSYNSPVFTGAIITSSSGKQTSNNQQTNSTGKDIEIAISGNYPYIDHGVHKNLHGTVKLNQIRTVGKERIVGKKICSLTTEMNEIDEKLLNEFGLSNELKKKDNLIQSLQGKVSTLIGRSKS